MKSEDPKESPKTSKKAFSSEEIIDCLKRGVLEDEERRKSREQQENSSSQNQ